ncbi:MAG: bifunctional demethylmenaquinone methyltransferase/2-methoxy-6-polyprenyl-1,4-benzoquinol methylase UbiE [Muribaculaceae bacterium]|nr:bifunctional demethylmenaquinone methyltransferase/2-methoxy-6-polyprenyl-1,4-benzoquinol methylase UbiE [Muribaculaceae bacterium]
MKVEDINPYNQGEEKGKEVEQMFDSIARRYDLMNSAMSLGQHKIWRNKALKAALTSLPSMNKIKVLDVATGTGDVAFRLHTLLPEALITGIDLSEGMLKIARDKLSSLPYKEQELIAFGKGDSLSMPFHDAEFNLLTVAYGVRNFSDLRRGLIEMRRVLKRGGVLCIIELSTPKGVFTKPAYSLYSGKIIPWLGKKVTGDDRAYSYLPESIAACPQREDMAALLYASGFTQVEWKSLSFGALTYYIAK